LANRNALPAARIVLLIRSALAAYKHASGG
jgi:hypothetical protein